MAQKKSKKLIVIRIVLILCIGVFIYAAFRVGEMIYAYAHNQAVQSSYQQAFFTESEPKTEKTYVLDEEEDIIPSYDFSKLLEINSEIIGWIYYPDLGINYPVVQAADNDKYLHLNINGNYEYAGSVFADYRCDAEAFQNLVLYGHNMLDDSMFGRLDDFYTGHPSTTFWYLTPDAQYRCDIISVYLTNVYVKYCPVYFDSDEDLLSHARWMVSKSDVELPQQELCESDRYISLSTCNRWNDGEDGRLCVFAKVTELEPKKTHTASH